MSKPIVRYHYCDGRKPWTVTDPLKSSYLRSVLKHWNTKDCDHIHAVEINGIMYNEKAFACWMLITNGEIR